MKSTLLIHVSLVIAGTVAVANLHAQTNPDWEIESTFAFAQSHAVGSDPADDVTVMAAGSGFMMLNGSADQPVPMTGTSLFDPVPIFGPLAMGLHGALC